MRVSVIVPTLNEAIALPITLTCLQAQAPFEIIVADGGSTDQTLQCAAAAGARVVQAPRGRALQMNAGAAVATGDALLFLHADCTLEDGALGQIPKLLSRRGVAGGCMLLAIPQPQPLYRGIEWCAAARVRLFGIAYGDQGIFVRRDVFEQIQGFPDLRLMEDVWFSLQLRRRGRLVISERHIYVSARRWVKSGIIRQTLRNWTLTILAAAGVHPNWLARFYPHVR